MPIDPGHKYGMLALPRVVTARDLTARLDLREGLWAFTELPFGIPEHWQGWIGSLRYRALDEGDLFLVAGGPAEAPDVLNNENEHYVGRAFDLYLGLLVMDHVFAHEGPTRLTGANREGEVDVRSMSQLEPPRWIEGAPYSRVTVSQLEEAAALTPAIFQLRDSAAFKRLEGSFRAFYRGIRAEYLDETVHQFVRCVEGFVLPEPGRTLARLRSRTELFLGPGHHERVGEWFHVRSAVEHLHPALEVVPGDGFRERAVRLGRKALGVEALARHCLGRVLRDDELRSWFETDARIEAFWALGENERQELWGDAFDVNAVEDSFREEAIPTEENA